MRSPKVTEAIWQICQRRELEMPVDVGARLIEQGRIINSFAWEGDDTPFNFDDEE